MSASAALIFQNTAQAMALSSLLRRTKLYCLFLRKWKPMQI